MLEIMIYIIWGAGLVASILSVYATVGMSGISLMAYGLQPRPPKILARELVSLIAFAGLVLLHPF